MEQKKKSCLSCSKSYKVFFKWHFVVGVWIAACAVKENIDIIRYILSLF